MISEFAPNQILKETVVERYVDKSLPINPFDQKPNFGYVRFEEWRAKNQISIPSNKSVVFVFENLLEASIMLSESNYDPIWRIALAPELEWLQPNNHRKFIEFVLKNVKKSWQRDTTGMHVCISRLFLETLNRPSLNKFITTKQLSIDDVPILIPQPQSDSLWYRPPTPRSKGFNFKEEDCKENDEEE